MNDDDASLPLLDPPYSRRLLAELHAGALEEGLANALWPRVRADPDAVAVLDGLDVTVRQLGSADRAQVPIPPQVAARIDQALAAVGTESSAAVIDLAAARATRRQRGRYARVGLVAAAAAVAGVVALGTVLGTQQQVSGTPQAAVPAGDGPAAPPASAPLLDLGSDAGGPQVLAALGHHDLGPLSEESRRNGCLAANGLPPTAEVAASAEVRLNGRLGILLLVPTGRAAVFTALVVGPECSAQDPATRSKVDVGPR